ncbi:Uncharacterised protein [Staphylococcus aureus]|nr:Uncharacterised protein [Staphylococcus aureus]
MKISDTTISAIIRDTEILIISRFLLTLDLGTLGNLEKLTINKIVVIVSTTSCVNAKSGAFIAIKNKVTTKPMTPFKMTMVSR